MKTLSPENKLVVLSAGVNTDREELLRTLGYITNWKLAVDKLIARGVAPLFLNCLPKKNLLSEVTVSVTSLHQAYLKTLARNLLLYDAFGEIATELQKQGIKSVALKGIFLAEHLYPETGLRQLSDIDLLFSQEDIPATLDVLHQLGFTDTETGFSSNVTQYMEHHHLPPLVRKGVSVELHTRLHSGNLPYSLDEKAMSARALNVIINNRPFYAFEPTDQLIHVATHLDHHFYSSQVQCYGFADVARLLEKYVTEIDWSIFRNRCREYNAENEVMRQLVISHQIFGAPLPEILVNNYTYLYDKKAETRLFAHLDNRASTPYGTKTHLKNLRKIANPFNRIRYALEVIFPPEHLMIKTYKIKNKAFYWLWYPYRLWIGFKGLIR